MSGIQDERASLERACIEIVHTPSAKKKGERKSPEIAQFFGIEFLPRRLLDQAPFDVLLGHVRNALSLSAYNAYFLRFLAKAAMPDTTSALAASGPSQPLTLTHLPASRSL